MMLAKLEEKKAVEKKLDYQIKDAKKQDNIQKNKFNETLEIAPGKGNKDWRMQGDYYTKVTSKGKHVLIIGGKLVAPKELQKDKSHFVSWVINKQNKKQYLKEKKREEEKKKEEEEEEEENVEDENPVEDVPVQMVDNFDNEWLWTGYRPFAKTTPMVFHQLSDSKTNDVKNRLCREINQKEVCKEWHSWKFTTRQPKLMGKEMKWKSSRPYEVGSKDYVPLKLGQEGLTMHFQFYSDNGAVAHYGKSNELAVYLGFKPPIPIKEEAQKMNTEPGMSAGAWIGLMSAIAIWIGLMFLAYCLYQLWKKGQT